MVTNTNDIQRSLVKQWVRKSMFVAACSILIRLPVVAYHYSESLTPISFFLIYFVFAVILDSKIVLFTLCGILAGLVIASHIDDDPFSVLASRW